MPALSVILTTYNKPQDLIRSLEGFRRQTVTDFEILVCDDGSGPETKDVIDAYRSGVPFPVHHVWQEDDGFRAAGSRNNGARRAEGETLVFVDGDCVPLPDFLEVHAKAQRPDRFQGGERYMLEQDEADLVTVENIASQEVFGRIPPRELKRVKATRRKDAFYSATRLKDNRPRLMTSNCSMSLEAFRRVNGLDERYEGWGQEDEDLRRRLIVRGITPSSVVGDANCLHLWHKGDKTFLGTRRLSPNWLYYERGFRLSRCRHGLVERPLTEVRGNVLGSEPEPTERVRRALGLAAPQEGERLEVEVLVDTGHGRPLKPSGAAEVTVLIASALTPKRTKGVDVVLAPGLEVQGGELPTEKHPPVDPQLAKLGVKALRPLPSGDLADAALTEARDCLDALL